MQSGQRYGIPPNMQPFVGVQAPHMFGHSQSVPSMSQTRSNVQPPREHMQSPHQNLQHPAHVAQSHPQPVPQQYHPRHSQLPQQAPTLHQSVNGLPYHQYLKPQIPLQQFVQQLRPDSHSQEITAAFTGSPLQNKSNQLVPGSQNFVHDGVLDESERENAFNRWQSEETAALLRICSGMDASFRDGSLGLLWEEVSRKLRDIGHHRIAKECKEKFENAQKYFKKLRNGNPGRQDGTNVHLFREPEGIRSTDRNNHDSGTSGGSSPGGLGVRSAVKGVGSDAVERRDGGSAAAPFPQAAITCGAVDFSCDSSEDEHVHLDVTHEQDRRKRRKRQFSGLRSRVFFEKLTRQIMEQQEALHVKFLETIEQRDRERLIRDEAYKRQETARLNREQELRAQELALAATRDAAVIAFLEKATGRTLQLPKVVPQAIQTTCVSDVQEEKAKDVLDINSKRWPKVEVHALIRLRSGMEPRFQEAGPKAHLWQEISTSMACMGFSRSAKRCKEKWENINKYFKKTKDICKKRPENAKTCPYFQQLNTLYQRGILASSGNRFKSVENPSETLLEKTTENAGFIEDEKAEMLSIRAAGEDGSNSGQVTSSSAVKLLSDGDKSTQAAGQMVLEISQSPAFPDPYTKQPSALGSQTDGVQAHIGGTAEEKSLRLETFVKDILELQQQQHQKLVDEYDRMEQARELSELNKQQEQRVPFPHDQSHSNTHDDTALMALVHRFSGDPSDLAVSAPSRME